MKAGFNISGARAWAARAVLAASAFAASAVAFATPAATEPHAPQPWQLNMGKGVTHSSNMAWEAHMVALWVCVVIGVIVFGAMAYAMWKFRKSKGAVANVNFTHSTKLEIVWTLVPVILLVGMAWPAPARRPRRKHDADSRESRARDAVSARSSGLRLSTEPSIT